MYLNELNTLYESKLAVEMAADGVCAVLNRVTVQHVGGPVFKTYPREGHDGKVTVDLYVAWDDDSMLPLHRYVDHRRTTVEGAVEYAKQVHMDTYENYVAFQDELSEKSGWVSVVDAEFVRRRDPARYAMYMERRRNYLEQQEAARKARAEIRMAQVIRKREEEAKREEEQRNNLKGWVRNMTALPLPWPYRKLRQLVVVDGKLMSWAEFLVTSVAGGWKPYTYEDERNGKRMYRLRRGELSYRIDEMQFEYAKYVYKHMPAKAKKKGKEGVA